MLRDVLQGLLRCCFAARFSREEGQLAAVAELRVGNRPRYNSSSDSSSSSSSSSSSMQQQQQQQRSTGGLMVTTVLGSLLACCCCRCYAPAARRGLCTPATSGALAECCAGQHRPSPSSPVASGLDWARVLPASGRRPSEAVHIQWHVCSSRSPAAWQCWCARWPRWLQRCALRAGVRRHRSACARGVWDVLPDTC